MPIPDFETDADADADADSDSDIYRRMKQIKQVYCHVFSRVD